jgi:hypothetical protein
LNAKARHDQENANIINNLSMQRKQGWNQQKQSTYQGKYSDNFNNSSNFKQPPLRDLILEQTRINDNIVKNLASNDKILEDINVKMNDFSSTIKDQLNHNKKIETQLAQLAVGLPIATNPEQVHAITTRGGKSTRDPLYPKGTERMQTAPVAPPVAEEKEDNEVKEVDPPIPELQQFSKFVEVI